MQVSLRAQRIGPLETAIPIPLVVQLTPVNVYDSRCIMLLLFITGSVQVVSSGISSAGEKLSTESIHTVTQIL